MDKIITIKEGVEVAILSPLGIVEEGYIVHNDDRIRSGSIVVKDKIGELLKVNPDRVVHTSGVNSVIVYDDNEKPYAMCPQCKKPTLVSISPESDITECVCPQHDSFKCYINNKIKPQKALKATNNAAKPISKFVDFDKIALIGELWIKNGVDFDHEKTEVQSCFVIFKSQNRYITFNVYNGSYGKKNSRPPFEDIANGFKLGYEIKNIEALRSKYLDKGYKLHKPTK